MKKMIFVFVLVLLLLCGCASVQTPEEIPSESVAENETSSETEEVPEPEQEEDVPVVNGWTADFKPEDFETYEEYEKAFLDEYVKHLEPLEFIETEKEYPEVILEIFDLIMAEQTVEFLKCEELRKIEVLGDENEFYATYFYLGKEGSTEALMIRMRKIEDGKYGLLGRGGGGPLGHGLEKSDLTLEDILNEN